MPSIEVRLDGVIIDADGRSALPVDPGPHTVTATAPGRRPWRVDVVANESSVVTVPVGPLDLAPSAPSAPLGPSTAAPPADIPRAPSSVSGPASSWHVQVGATAIAVGGAGLILGAVTGALVLSQHATLVSECHNGVCPSSYGSELSSYHLKSTLSTVGFVAGGVLAAAGIVILATAPPRSPSIGLFVGPGSMNARGSF